MLGAFISPCLLHIIPLCFGELHSLTNEGRDSPGRWFAVLMLKMIVAYVTMHYDIEATGPVPKMRVIGDATLPPMFATMRVRRRRREGRE